MSFDKPTRNALGKMVGACRGLLTEDIKGQLQRAYGLQPDGTALPLERLAHLDEQGRDVAAALREWWEHLAAQEVGSETERRRAAFDRMAHETAFTVLNRLAALRMCEERALVLECVRRGTESDGFALFEAHTGGMLGTRSQAYRAFLERLFDELAVDLGVLFDRFAPHSAVFPTERCMEDVLAELNKPELAHLWTEDETIGWVYQYFNPPEERKAMREASQAPRNSRELAVRNQFFTPRYVVEFLTDNTLGRIWYEMRKGDTALKEECRYLVRRPKEIFLAPEEKAPAAAENEADLSQEELLKKPVHIEHRPKKDPRNLRVLDPACGSGHFLLYAFDLLERIYQEAWEDPESLKSEITGRTLRDEYETLDDLRKAVPKLIIEHNLHGIDIDPRCVHISALALWLRAQRAWKNLGLKAADRPRIAKTNIVTAEPMPGEEDMRREFTAGLKPRVLGQLVDVVFEKMKLAGEAGSLLKIEEEIKDAVAEARKQWLEGPKPEQQLLFFPGMADSRPKQQELRFDAKGITDERFWEQAEDRILEALKEYAERAENGYAVRRHLFAEDAARGFAFVDLCRKRYDVVLMNPPFGLPTPAVEEYAKERFKNTWQDIYGSFLDRTQGLTQDTTGLIGAITPKSFYHAKGFRGLRDLLQEKADLVYSIDVGGGVLDAAVEVCFSVFGSRRSNVGNNVALFCNLVSAEKSLLAEKVMSFVDNIRLGNASHEIVPVCVYEKAGLPNEMLPYRFPADLLQLLRSSPSFESGFGNSVVGITTFDNDRFIRLMWETPEALRRNKEWLPVAMGGGWAPFYDEFNLVVKWKVDAAEMRANELRRYNTTARTMQSQRYWFRPGLTFSKISKSFSVQPFPAGSVFTSVGFCIFPTKLDNWTWLGYFNSKPVCCLMSLFSADRHWHSNSVAFLPVPATLSPEVGECAKKAFVICAELGRLSETAPEFLYCELAGSLDELSRIYGDITHALASEIADAFALSRSTFEFLSQNAIYAAREFSFCSIESARRRLSYALGSAFGRWDVRIAMDSSLAPRVRDPFDPLPVCPPGMLVGPDGLPADSGRIVSEEWLRARPDANSLPPEGSVKNPTTPDDGYPLRINWDGFLVNDAGINGGRLHRDDIIRRVSEVLDLLWKDKAHEIEQEACDILGVADLRDYFRRPAGFFQDHLKRYSKSRRQAPIYWPLSTASGSYIIWIYYHRLNDDILYKAVNDYVNPKIAETQRRILQLESELASASGRQATRLRGELEERRLLREELEEFKAELLRVAGLPYKPNLNDGVLITASPLWRLFRLPKWRGDLEACWRKLEAGEYDWAHLAFAIWPDRVKEKCWRDRSIAIAHGLEDLYQGEASTAAKRSRRAHKP